MTYQRVFVLGGARSGKSAFAERLASRLGKPVVYVATATASDEEMAARIAHHRAARPATWRTVEVPTGVADRVALDLRDGETILVEDLTLLLSNLMAEGSSRAEDRAIGEIQALLALPADLILVSNEVGMGIVPPFPLGREFRDALGRVNQATAAACEAVYILFAGLPLQLK